MAFNSTRIWSSGPQVFQDLQIYDAGVASAISERVWVVHFRNVLVGTLKKAVVNCSSLRVSCQDYCCNLRFSLGC